MPIEAAELKDGEPERWMTTRFETLEEWKRTMESWGSVTRAPKLDQSEFQAFKLSTPREKDRFFGVQQSKELVPQA